MKILLLTLLCLPFVVLIVAGYICNRHADGVWFRCGWCKRYMNDTDHKPQAQPPLGYELGQESHGICAECFDKMKAQLQRNNP